MHHEGRNAVEVLEGLEAVRDRVLLGILEGKVVRRLEDTLQHPPQCQSRPRRIGQVLKGLAQFGHRRDPNLVQIEVTLQQSLERLLGQLIGRILEAAGVEHLLQDRPTDVRRNRLVLRSQRLVHLGDQLLAIGLLTFRCAHAFSWGSS